jgi:putative transcriptional regulator
MSKHAFDNIKAELQDAIAIARGEADPSTYRVHVPADVDVKAIRRKLGMTQAEFARSFGFGLDAVQNWEQGRRRPEGAARAFLKVIDREPDAVRRALAA